jgi:hypothetical protein
MGRGHVEVTVMVYKPLLWTVLLLSFVPLLGSLALHQPPVTRRTLERTVDPVTIDGEHFPNLLGSRIGHLRLFAFQHGTPVPVPFQIDQRDSNDDWVWDVAYTESWASSDSGFDETPASDQGEGHPGRQDDEDPPGKQILDGNDMLVFLARDVGDRDVEAEKALAATRGDEIEVTDPVNGAKGWAYLAYYDSSPPAPSPTRYIRYSVKERRLVSPVYSFSFSNTKVAVIKDLAIRGAPVLDRIHIYGLTHISVGPIEKQVHFTEEDVRGYLAGYIAGPVRVVTRTPACIDLGFGICSPEVFCLRFYYLDYARVPACLLVRFPVHETSLILALDYGSSPFRRLLIGSNQGISVWDKGTPKSSPQGWQQGKWVALDGKNGSVVSYVTLPKALAGYAEAKPYLAFGQRAGRNTTPTEVGFKIDAPPGTPKGKYLVYGTYVISPAPYRPGDGTRALNLRDNPLKFRVSRRLGSDIGRSGGPAN